MSDIDAITQLISERFGRNQRGVETNYQIRALYIQNWWDGSEWQALDRSSHPRISVRGRSLSFKCL